MVFIRPQFLVALCLSSFLALPSFAVDDATMTRLQELLDKAKSRTSSTTLSTRDLKKEGSKEATTSPALSTPVQSSQPVINVNQHTEVHGGEVQSGSGRSIEEILNRYKEKRETQTSPEPVTNPVSTPSPSPAKPSTPVKPSPAKKPTSVAPTPQAPAKTIPTTTSPTKKDQIKIETKNEVSQPPVKTNIGGSSSSKGAASSTIKKVEEEYDTEVLDKTRAVTPDTTTSSSESKTASAREADYHLVLRKSLKSLEEDAWNDVKYNMGEAKDYFTREKNTYKEPIIDVYYKIIAAFQRFAEAGLELDQGDFADFEEAEALYLDSYDLLDEAEKQLKKIDGDLNAKNIKEIINIVRGYIDEDLGYIEEMIGID
jgi:hypothetical protein